MKAFSRQILINLLAFILIAKITGAVVFGENYVILSWAAFFLSVLNLLVKPILNLLLTPINLLTLGAFRWVVNVLVLFFVTILVSEFRVVGFTFPGYSLAGFVIPQIHLTFFWALILVSFLLELFSAGLNWLFS